MKRFLSQESEQMGAPFLLELHLRLSIEEIRIRHFEVDFELSWTSSEKRTHYCEWNGQLSRCDLQSLSPFDFWGPRFQTRRWRYLLLMGLEIPDPRRE